MFFPFFFPPVALAQEATPSATFISVPSQATKSTPFNISFKLADAKPEIYYRFKVYGGANNETNSIEVNYASSSWANGGDSNSWDLMPQYQTDKSGNIKVNLNIRTTSSGSYKIYAKAKESGSSTEISTSSAKDLTVVEPTSAPTATPTLTPTPTKTATPTPKPTTEPTPTTMPPTPTDVPQITNVSPSVTQPIEIDNLSPLPTPVAQKSFNFLPFIFIGGGLLFLVPILILHFRR